MLLRYVRHGRNLCTSADHSHIRLLSTTVSNLVNAELLVDLSASDRELGDLIVSGDRYALSRGITLVESRKLEDRSRCSKLLTYVLQQSNNKPRSSDRLAYKIGITGMC